MRYYPGELKRFEKIRRALRKYYDIRIVKEDDTCYTVTQMRYDGMRFDWKIFHLNIPRIVSAYEKATKNGVFDKTIFFKRIKAYKKDEDMLIFL